MLKTPIFFSLIIAEYWAVESGEPGPAERQVPAHPDQGQRLPLPALRGGGRDEVPQVW